MIRSALVLVIFPATLLAQATRTTHADTTFIAAKGAGLWGPSHPAIEVARIGSGPAHETLLSSPKQVTALPDGGVIFFDEKSLDGPVIRLFDAQGKFVRNIGRSGSGPGEFRSGLDIKIAADGRIWVADPGNARVNIYARDGKFVSQVKIPGNSWSLDMLRPGSGGNFYLTISRVLHTDGKAPMIVQSFVQMDSVGLTIDTLTTPRALGAAADEGLERPAILSDGRLVVPARDRVGFVIQQGTPGQHQVLAAWLDMPRVRYTTAERERRDSVAKTGGRGGPPGRPMASSSMPPLPEFKNPVANLKVDGENRIWIQRTAPTNVTPVIDAISGRAAYLTPVFYDAFRADGAFLGEVAFPKAQFGNSASFAGNFAWLVVDGDDGDVYLVKYRLR